MPAALGAPLPRSLTVRVRGAPARFSFPDGVDCAAWCRLLDDA